MTDPLSLSYIVEGEIGHPTLLVHDLHASLHDWDTLIPSLVVSGHHVFACDLLGHGQSPHLNDPRQNYAQMHVTAFRRWVDSLELERAPILIGHGFGAYLSLRYALGHPYRVFRLILINPLLLPDQYPLLVQQIFRYRQLAKLAWEYLPEWTTRTVLGLPKEGDLQLRQRVWASFLKASSYNLQIPLTIADLTPDLYTLPTRSLFICGEDDPLTDMSILPSLLEDVPDNVSVFLPGVGHRPHLEAPHETSKLISKFLLGL